MKEQWSEIVPPLQLGKKYKYFFQVKRARKIIANREWKKQLCACTKLNYCTILYLIFVKSIFWVKNGFSSKTGRFSIMEVKKADQRVKNFILGENLVIKGLSKD